VPSVIRGEHDWADEYTDAIARSRMSRPRPGPLRDGEPDRAVAPGPKGRQGERPSSHIALVAGLASGRITRGGQFDLAERPAGRVPVRLPATAPAGRVATR